MSSMGKNQYLRSQLPWYHNPRPFKDQLADNRQLSAYRYILLESVSFPISIVYLRS